jgi:hypothetical protein
MTTTTFYLHFDHDHDITSKELRDELTKALRDVAAYIATSGEIANCLESSGGAGGNVRNDSGVVVGKFGLLHVMVR